MPDIEVYFDEIDLARIRRVKELSELKRLFAMATGSDPLGIQSKAVVVLSYASWEGFYNDCVTTYRHFLSDQRVKVVDAGWFMLVGALSSDFESLRARNHSRDAKRDFVEKLKERLECQFDQFDISTIQARSNLDFGKLSSNYALLGFDVGILERYRVRINKEVVGWRHGVSHGNAPNLNGLDVSNHVDFVGEFLALVADQFQKAMLERL
jgi:hypothetical protein